MTLAKQTIVEVNGLTMRATASIEAAHLEGGIDSNGCQIITPIVRLIMKRDDTQVIMQFSSKGFRLVLEDLLSVLDAEPLPVEWASLQ